MLFLSILVKYWIDSSKLTLKFYHTWGNFDLMVGEITLWGNFYTEISFMSHTISSTSQYSDMSNRQQNMYIDYIVDELQW